MAIFNVKLPWKTKKITTTQTLCLLYLIAFTFLGITLVLAIQDSLGGLSKRRVMLDWLSIALLVLAVVFCSRSIVMFFGEAKPQVKPPESIDPDE